ncbi:hypothetical protein QFC22_004583 [Naganishia vaughanmartiniae]|uniref:Uncharacterized protein n=1 Tax=Naganishia vaughanmartiniae TaxID=1424756 RepID=A0ACC2X0I9_9TREE|nr:hypothetical protein QFC22_004583 [Naganishia vaughanmartiniae]
MSGVSPSPRSSFHHVKSPLVSSATKDAASNKVASSNTPSPFSPTDQPSSLDKDGSSSFPMQGAHAFGGDGPSKVPEPRRGSLIATQGGRRGSGAVMTPSGQTIAYHTRTQDDITFPAAEKKTMADHLRKYEALFTLTPQRMRMIVNAFEETLDRGLQKDGEIVPMIPTFVFGYPDGTETGEYLALDLGGTNLRVCLVTLRGQGKFEITQTKYKLTDEQKQDDGQKLFDFCAECLASFITDNLGRTSEDPELPLSFTFSYPCAQTRIDHGELIRWTKGFGAPNVEGHDVAAMFAESLAKFNVPIKLTSLINDTTGTLIASNYVDPNTKIAVIFGTGCNAAYMETVGNIPKMKHLGLPDDQEMAINYDIIIDESSNKPGEQSFEKMIAGLYLGEVFRLVLTEMIDAGDLFLGQNTYKLEKEYAMDTAFLSLMESDPTDELLTVVGVFTYFFGIETTLEERQFFRSLAKLIGTRAARLSACGIAAIVSKKGYLEKGCSVGADGSLYNKYPGFADRIHQALVDIFGEAGRQVPAGCITGLIETDFA